MKENIIDWQGEFEKNATNAFNLVYDQFYNPLRYYAISILQQKEDAEDIIADVFRKFYERQEKFDHINPIRAFLRITCHNDCINYLKTKEIKRKNLADFAGISDSDTLTDSSSYQVDASFLAWLEDRINDLPDETQKVIRESFHEHNAEKVALKLGKNGQNVRNLKAKGVQLLREALQKKFKKTFLFVLLIRVAGCFN